MTRINAIRNIAAPRDSVAWGKTNTIATAIWGNINALTFAAVLIVCSLAVGCSSEKPKNISSNNETPVTQAPVAPMPAPIMQAENKPAPKKSVQHKRPATVNYTDKTYGVTFEYPRRYAIETGNAATEVLTTSPIPMNFVQPGGVAIAAVELPETGFANTDFSSAFFNVSVHKGLTADQCSQFAVPAPKMVAQSELMTEPKAEVKEEAKKDEVKKEDVKQEVKQEASAQSNTLADAKPAPSAPVTEAQSSTPSSTDSASTQASSSQSRSSQTASNDSASKSATATSSAQSEAQGSKLLLGDLELHGTEAVSGEGTRQSDAKYFHVYQNGSCYEFAMNVTTVASDEGMTKHVDRDKVFSRLEKILGTVKINPIAPEVSAESPAPTPAPAGTPAQ